MIDTIFYFADTMDEYRDLVETQQISARTIVFVEETLEIYKNGKLYPDISGVKKAINNASTKSWLDTVRAIGELNNELREAFNASITDTNASLAEARTRIDEVRAKLINNKGDALIDIDKTNGLIELFAEYWNASNGTYTNFENIWNAQAGKAGLTAEFVNTVNSTLTTYQNIVDIVNANKDEWIKFSDVANASETEISEEWDAAKANAIRKLKKVDTIDQKLTTIYEKWQIQEDGTSVWDTLNAQVTENTTALSGILTLVNTDGALASLIAAYTDGDLTFLSDLKTHANGDESYFDLTAAKILGALDKDNENKVAARIFGYVKNNVSNLELTADKIKIGENVTLTDELSTIKGQLLVDGNVTAKAVVVGTNPQILINSTDGIKHTGGKFQINMDGSGFFGNENSKISWTPDGTITVTGVNIVGSSNVPDGYDELKNKVNSWAYLGSDEIKFQNSTDEISFSLTNGLKHLKKNTNPLVNGYWLKNDGSGSVANEFISWATDGSGNIGGPNGIHWDTEGNLTLGSAVGGKSEGTTYAYLTDTGILFNNTNDKVELKSPSGTNGGLIHTYKENEQDTNNHGYALYNDGSGLIANNVIHWDNEGNLTIGYKSNDPEGVNNSLTWDKDGNLIIGANFIVQGPDYSLEFSDIDKALADLDLYNKSRAYITDAGIIIDNQNTLNRVTLATTDVGLIHLEIESYTEDGETKYRVKQDGRSAYGFYNDGHGHVANGNITWGIDGSGNIGGADGISWDTNGNVTLGSLVLGKVSSTGSGYDDTAISNRLKEVEDHYLNKDNYAYLTNVGILFNNQTDGNLVELSSVSSKDASIGGLIHTYIDANGQATTNPPTHGYALYNDGTGELANGHIKWGLKTVTEEQNGQQVQVEKAWLSIDADDLNIYSGKDGQDGKQGANGQDGHDGLNLVNYIYETVTSDLNLGEYLKISELGSHIDNLNKYAKLSDIVSESTVKGWTDSEVDRYIDGKDFLTGTALSGFVTHDQLKTALRSYKLDGEWNICVDLDGNYIRGKFSGENDSIFTTENGVIYTKQTTGENAGKYTSTQTDRILTPVYSDNDADMSAEINKLNAYFIVAVDKNVNPHVRYEGQFLKDETNGEYFKGRPAGSKDEDLIYVLDSNKYLLDANNDPILENGEPKENPNYEKYVRGNIALTKLLGMASSVEIASLVNDYITNETALSSLTTWADNITRLKNSGKAGFTLQALLAAITGAPLTAEGNDSVSISGLVDAYNSSLELSSSQIVTGVDALTNAKITLDSKLTDLEGRTFASALQYNNVTNAINNLDNNYLGKNEDISDKVLGYLVDNNLIKSDGNLGYVLDEDNIDLSNYTLKTEFTEAIAGLKSRIGNAESSIVSKTTLNKILRRHQLLDKQLNETITNSEQVELTQIEADLARLAELLDDSTILNDIESRKILLEKSELTSDEQSALDVYNNYLSEYDALVETYGDDPELYNTYLESVIYNYISTSNKIQSKIDDEVASIETLVTKETKRVDDEDITVLLSGVKISADDIYLNGNTWANSIFADSLNAKTLHSYSGQTSSADGYHVEILNGIIEGYKKETTNGTTTNTVIYKFNNDGTGNIGSNFSWDASGNVTLSGVNAESVQTSSNNFHVDISNGVIEGYSYSNNTKTEIYKFNDDGSGKIGNNFSWTSAGVVTLSGVNAASVQTSSNDFHVDIMDGYIKGYTTGNDTPSYYFKNDGGGSLAYGNITWDTLDLNITVGEHSIILFLEKIDSSNQNANVNPLYFTNGGNTYNGYELSNLGFVLYHGANNGGYETVLSSEGFKVFKHSENGVYNTQLELTPYGTGILANGNITWGFSDETLELSLTGNINLVNNSTNIVINERDLLSVIENGESTLKFIAGNDSVGAYTGELTIGDLTLTFINGILIQV